MELSCVIVRLAEFHATGTAYLARNGEEKVRSQFQQIANGVDLSHCPEEGTDDATKESKLVREMSFAFRDFSRFVRRLPGHLHAFKSCEQSRPQFVETMMHSSRCVLLIHNNDLSI